MTVEKEEELQQPYRENYSLSLMKDMLDHHEERIIKLEASLANAMLAMSVFEKEGRKLRFSYGCTIAIVIVLVLLPIILQGIRNLFST